MKHCLLFLGNSTVLGLILDALFKFRRPAELKKLIPPEDIESDHDSADVSPDVAANSIENAETADLYGTQSQNATANVNTAASLAIVGAALGVQAVIVVFLFCLFLIAVATLGRRATARFPKFERELPPTVYVFLATILVLLIWDSTHRQFAELVAQTL